MSDDYSRGQRDGLRLALDLLSAEEAKWAALVDERAPWRTTAARQVRRKAFAVAIKRIGTILNRVTPKDGTTSAAELDAALDKLGL
jgi:hypothetical protein